MVCGYYGGCGIKRTQVSGRCEICCVNVTVYFRLFDCEAYVSELLDCKAGEDPM